MRRSIQYLIISVLLISFIAFGDSTDLGSLCEELLVRRTEAWNKIVTEGYNYAAFYNEMNTVASGKLLKEDLETFVYLKENPTDMEKVISLKLQEEKIQKDGINVLLEGKIVWNLEGQEDIEVMEGYYRIEMQKDNGSWYLMDFQPI